MKNQITATFQAINVPRAQTHPLPRRTPITSRTPNSDIGDQPCGATKMSDLPETYAIYRMIQVIRLTGLSRSSIYRLESLSMFPARVKLSASASGWRSEDVHCWIANRPLAVKQGRKMKVLPPSSPALQPGRSNHD